MVTMARLPFRMNYLAFRTAFYLLSVSKYHIISDPASTVVCLYRWRHWAHTWVPSLRLLVNGRNDRLQDMSLSCRHLTYFMRNGERDLLHRKTFLPAFQTQSDNDVIIYFYNIPEKKVISKDKWKGKYLFLSMVFKMMFTLILIFNSSTN